MKRLRCPECADPCVRCGKILCEPEPRLVITLRGRTEIGFYPHTCHRPVQEGSIVEYVLARVSKLRGMFPKRMAELERLRGLVVPK